MHVKLIILEQSHAKCPPISTYQPITQKAFIFLNVDSIKSLTYNLNNSHPP